MVNDIEDADGQMPERSDFSPQLHFRDFRLRFVDGSPLIENTETGDTVPFGLGISRNYIIRGQEDGREYMVQLEGAEVMVTLTVLNWDPVEGERLAAEREKGGP